MNRYVLALLVSVLSLHAAPFGNILAPAVLETGFFIPSECWVNLRAGYEGDFVFNSRLKQVHVGTGSVDRCSQITNSGTITLNVLNRLDLYGVLGSSSFSSRWRFMQGSVTRSAHMQTEHALLWAVGGRAVLAEWGKWGLGIGGRYSAIEDPISYLTVDGASVPLGGGDFIWREVQVNLGVSYTIDFFIPYLAVHYQMARARVGPVQAVIADRSSPVNYFQSVCPVGIDLGCTLSNGKYFMLNIEARLISEEAMSVSGDFRF